MAGTDVAMTENMELSSKVFSNVMATLSTTLVDTFPGAKDIFLTEFIQLERATVYSDIASHTLCISGTIEQIIQCQAKLSRLILADKDCLTLWKRVQQACEGVKHLFVNTGQTKTRDVGVMCDILTGGPCKFVNECDVVQKNNLNNANLAEGDADDIDATDDKSLLRRKINSKYKLYHAAVSPDADDSDFEVVDDDDDREPPPVISTKRGRVIKRPAKLDNSVVQYLKKGAGQVDNDMHDSDFKGRQAHPRKVGRPRKRLMLADLEKQAHLTIVEQNVTDEQDSEIGVKIEIDDAEDSFEVHDHDQSTQNTAKMKKKKPAMVKYMRKFYEERMPYKFFCTICSFKSKRESHFTAHQKLHEKNPDMHIWQCSKCDFKTLRQSVLQRHSVSHESTILQCSMCSYKTNVLVQLKNHVRKHKKSFQGDMAGQLKCDQCSYRTLSKSKLMIHMQAHLTSSFTNSGKMFECEKCQYKTTRLVLMRRHQTTVHTDKRPYLCDFCGAAFKRTDALAEHKTRHLDKSKQKLPFKCTHCKKAFRSKSHLLEHMSVHSVERAFQCHICGNMFKTKAIQRRHQQIVHFNPGKLKCDRCDKTFKTKYALQRHSLTHDIEQSRAMQSGLVADETGVVQSTDGTGMMLEVERQLVKDHAVEEAQDENISAIQTITIAPENLNDFTQQLQSVSAQLQSGSDVGEVYIQGLENIDAGMISLVNMGDNNVVRHIFVPPASQDGAVEMADDGQMKQLYVTDKPDLATFNIAGSDELKEVLVSAGSSPDYVKRILVSSTAPDSGANVHELREILVGSDENASQMKQILVPVSADGSSALVNQTVLQLGDSIQNKNRDEQAKVQLIEQSQAEHGSDISMEGQSYEIVKDSDGQTLLTLNPASI